MHRPAKIGIAMNTIIPTVGDYMTPAPHFAAPEEKLSHAKSLMQEYGIRHLPVLHGGKLVGILTDGDVNFVHMLAVALSDSLTVEDMMRPKPYTVSTDAPLQQGARNMAERKVDVAIVVDHGVIAGVFTTTDALNALADVLEGKALRRDYESVPTAPPRGGRPLVRDLP
jgi:acetoin utilization protein AcuB